MSMQGQDPIPGREVTDETLIADIKAGSDHAFRVLTDRYQGLVSQLVWRLVANEADVQEVCQDVFLKMYLKLDQFRSDSKFSTWLYTIAYRTALSSLRKRRIEPTEDDVDDFEEAPQGLDEEVEALLHAAVAGLKLEERTVVTLFYVHGCSLEDVAAVVDKPVGTIKNLLFRVREKLKQKLAHQLGDHLKEVFHD